jgi:phage-related protein
MRQKGADGARSLFNAVVNGLRSLPSKMASVGREIVNGVWRGIQNARDHFYSSVKGFFSNIVGAAKGALGISSPSKVFEEEVGQYIPPGAERGIKKAMPSMIRNTVKDFNDMVAKVSDTINPVDISSASKASVNGTNYKDVDFANQSFGGLFTEENLQLLAEMLYGLLKDAPIVNNVNVSMEDGDVLLDSERVGRKIAPVVSRVQATGNV